MYASVQSSLKLRLSKNQRTEAAAIDRIAEIIFQTQTIREHEFEMLLIGLLQNRQDHTDAKERAKKTELDAQWTRWVVAISNADLSDFMAGAEQVRDAQLRFGDDAFDAMADSLYAEFLGRFSKPEEALDIAVQHQLKVIVDHAVKGLDTATTLPSAKKRDLIAIIRACEERQKKDMLMNVLAKLSTAVAIHVYSKVSVQHRFGILFR